MKILSKYITNISALQFIQLLRFSTLFIVSIVFVRYFTKSEIGEYEALLFIASALSFFWLRGILQTFLSLAEPIKHGKKSNTYFNAFLLLVIFSLLTILFLVLFKQSIETYLINSKQIPYFKWLVLYILFSTPSFLIEYLYVGINKPTKIFAYGFLSYGIQFIAVIGPTILAYNLEYAIIGLVITNFLRFVFLIRILFKYAKFSVSKTFLKHHFKLAYPLIFSSILSGSSQYIDGAIITHYFDSATFALYRYGAREFPLVIILANALSHAMIPEFTRLTYKNALQKLKSSSLKLMHLLFPITFALIILSNYLFPLFFTQEFSYSAKIFNVYLLLIVLRLVFPETILIGQRSTSVFPYISLVEIVINISLSILFVIKFGLIGVAFATLIANLFERIALIIFIKKKYTTSISEYVSVGWYSIYSISILICYIIVDFVIFA